MKNTFLLITLLSLINLNQTFAQLKLDAGAFKHICNEDILPGKITIGGNPTATMGTPPYKYTWTRKNSKSFYGSASKYLNDTTIANPTIIKIADTSTFYLSVEDSQGLMEKDTVTLVGSIFTMTTRDNAITIFSGDSAVIMNNVSGGIKPLKYAWSPNYHIADTTKGFSKAWPSQDTFYKLLVTDAAGCQVTDSYMVYVTVTGIEDKTSELNTTIFPNPLDENSVLVVNNSSNNEIEIVDILGRIIHKGKFSSTYSLGSISLLPGIYTCKIKDENGHIYSRSFNKN